MNERQSYVLEQRKTGKTLQEIADELGITRQRVQQIEQVALYLESGVRLNKFQLQRAVLKAIEYISCDQRGIVRSSDIEHRLKVPAPVVGRVLNNLRKREYIEQDAIATTLAGRQFLLRNRRR